jgi:hypothetical protein
VLAGAAVYAFLLHPLSTPLWRHVPGLAYFQFPWRMLGPLSLCAALAAALAFARFTANAGPAQRRRWELGLCLAAGLNALPQLYAGHAAGPVPRGELAHALAPDAARALGLGVTVYDEYLPRFVDRSVVRLRPLQGPVLGSRPPARVQVLRDEGTHIRLDVAAQEPTRLRLARWALPGWEASRGGRPLDLLPNRDGVLELEVPAGRSTLELRLRPPLARRVGLALSAACAVVLALLLLWPAARRQRPRRGA